MSSTALCPPKSHRDRQQRTEESGIPPLWAAAAVLGASAGLCRWLLARSRKADRASRLDRCDGLAGVHISSESVSGVHLTTYATEHRVHDSAEEWAASSPRSCNSSPGPTSRCTPGSMPSSQRPGSCLSTASARSNDLASAISIPGVLQSRHAGHASLQLGALLGKGSFGRVYKGRWKGATVAVKVIEHSSEDGSKLDGLRESLLASNIQHPNVLITYKVLAKKALARQDMGGEQDGCLDSASGCAGRRPTSADWQHVKSQECMEHVQFTWMVSKFCEKGNLDRAVMAGKFHDPDTREPKLVHIYRSLLDIAAGMDYLHSLGILHGDLKGANVLLKSSCASDDPRGFACKIGDFGLSRVLHADAAHVTTDNFGTVAYCAPEVLREGKLTRAADVYSFAIMMWELWAGEAVLRGLNSSQAFFKAIMGFRPAIPEAMPGNYRDLMTACWHEDPVQRPSFEEIERFLRRQYRETTSGMGSPYHSSCSLDWHAWEK